MRVEAQRHARMFRVLLDGRDVSAECFAADDAEGWAACYTGGPGGGQSARAREIRRGRVELRLAGRVPMLLPQPHEETFA